MIELSLYREIILSVNFASYYTLLLGGDLNCRYGNLNDIFRNQNMHYNDNMDVTSNNHGRTYGTELCKVGKIFPLNHLVGKKVFPGDFTYYKGGKKSQIDFVYTNSTGLKFIKDFIIPEND